MRALGPAVAVICTVLLAAGCAGSGPKETAHYTTTPPTTSGGCCLASPTGAQIDLARSSSPLFSIFPAAPGTKACLIPAGGVAFRRLHGTCRTVVQPARVHGPAFAVTFTETWTTCPPGAYCPASAALHHTWTIVVATSGLHILARSQSGAAPPQYND